MVAPTVTFAVRLATICPSDPFDGFFGWLACSFLNSIGLNPDKMHGDLVSSLLSSQLPAANGTNCSGLLEAFMGQTCVTQSLWTLTEAAAYPLIVAFMGARFARMLAHSNYQVSPGWAVADPMLRAVVAIALVHLSYPLLVGLHEVVELVATILFADITAKGGVAGVGLVFPANFNVLTDIIYWLYSIYVFFLFIASLIGYQICVVLAPLVIPIWVYSGQNQVFSWFVKTTGGALILPLAVATGWGVIVDMVHDMSQHFSGSVGGVVGGVVQWMLTVIVIAAGVWFMGKFVKATTGELFSGHLLTTMFLAGSVMALGGKALSAATPNVAKHALSRGVAWADSHGAGGLLPSGMTRAAEGYLARRMGLIGTVKDWARNNQYARHVMIDSMPRQALEEAADHTQNLARSAFERGDMDQGRTYLSWLTPHRAELATLAFERMAPADQYRVALRVMSGAGGSSRQVVDADTGVWQNTHSGREATRDSATRLMGDILEDPTRAARTRALTDIGNQYVPALPRGRPTPEQALEAAGHRLPARVPTP
jgi:hypothetical protein